MAAAALKGVELPQWHSEIESASITLGVTVRATGSERTLGEPPPCGVASKVLATWVAVSDSALPDLFYACG